MNVIEFTVRKWKIPTVGVHKSQSGIHLFKKLCVIHAAGSNTVFIGIRVFKVIGMAVCPVTRDANVKHRILPLNPGRGQKNIKHLAPLVGCDLDGDRVRGSEIVLGVYIHSASFKIHFSAAVDQECSKTTTDNLHTQGQHPHNHPDGLLARFCRQFSVGIFSAWSTTICSKLALRCSSLSPSFCTDE